MSTVLTMHAYSGIRTRARSTATETANQLKMNTEASNAIKGSYSTSSHLTGFLTDATAPEN